MPSRLRAFLMCTCARNAGLSTMGYAIGCAAGGRFAVAGLLPAAWFWFMLSTFVEGANRLSDRVEDEVNRPERTYLCHLIGFDRIRQATIVFGVAASAHAVAWSVLHGSWLLLALLFACIAVAGAYSFLPGEVPSLKRRRRLSPLLLATPTLGSFLVGWFSTGHPGLASVWGTPAAFLVVAFLVLVAIGGAKDVTDVVGDALIGYRSLWLDELTRRGRIYVAAAVPALAMVALGLLGPLPGVVVAGAPVVAGAIVLVGRRSAASIAAGGAGGVGVRALSSHLQLELVALVGLLSFWSPGLLLVVIVVSAYWFLADRWLYWSHFTAPVGLELQAVT